MALISVVLAAAGLHPSAWGYIAPYDVCPGEVGTQKERFDGRCIMEGAYRLCVQLLDEDRKPLTFGSDGDFWEVNRIQAGLRWDKQISDCGGHFSCVTPWATGELIDRVGCDSVNIRCEASDVKLDKPPTHSTLLKGWNQKLDSIDAVRECLRVRCPDHFDVSKKKRKLAGDVFGQLAPSGETDTYTWTQTNGDVEITFNKTGLLRSEKKLVNVKFHRTMIKVDVKSDILLHAALSHAIDVDSSTWTISDGMLQVSLAKAKEREMWIFLLREEVDAEEKRLREAALSFAKRRKADENITTQENVKALNVTHDAEMLTPPGSPPHDLHSGNLFWLNNCRPGKFCTPALTDHYDAVGRSKSLNLDAM
eukprot:gnl/MRDRNA2_/MRDRNA2_77247_c0_seq1.p1 gnl/MRDRNA2_/MRDRNA2_77247_c0~~gnl/MRDRNA2_/MRDRNA2_77247_c0_seq1.p1  ORF type:complete len:365 (+),score=74.13 gnl/MRDRNA2_/MRDRNA2_77247_c0_seq1:74-1168(+)